jgi:hypothetical protein
MIAKEFRRVCLCSTCFLLCSFGFFVFSGCHVRKTLLKREQHRFYRRIDYLIVKTRAFYSKRACFVFHSFVRSLLFCVVSSRISLIMFLEFCLRCIIVCVCVCVQLNKKKNQHELESVSNLMNFCLYIVDNNENIDMSDRDHLPLSTTLVKTLTDKLYEKRKTAALEIEK